MLAIKLLTQSELARRANVCEPHLRRLLAKHSITPDTIVEGNRLRLYAEEKVELLRRLIGQPTGKAAR